MKLATALSERSDIQNGINEIAVRLNNNSKVQKGDAPANNPTILMKELDRMIESLEFLMARINLTRKHWI